MKVYPVGRYRGVTRAVISALRAKGFEVVHDWTQATRDEDFYTRRATAHIDDEAVRACDVLLMMYTDGMKGAYFEMGMAHGLGKTIIVIDADRKDCIFHYHSDIEHVDSLDSAIALMEKLNGEA